MTTRCRIFWLVAILLLMWSMSTVSAAEWRAGVAKTVITPDKPLWMSGYASRTRPADQKIHDLWAKALVVEDSQAGRVAWVTLDLVGIDRDTSLSIRKRIEQTDHLEIDRVVLLCSHTHSGPVVGTNLISMYDLSESQQKATQQYTATLQDRVVELVSLAAEDLSPATICWGTGDATFAVNRRNNVEAHVPRLRAEGKLTGPTDHDVPVLSVRNENGELRAVLFGYACHATVLDGYQWCGDYPGFAQAALEHDHPQAVALFFAGCAGDQNPIPRRDLKLAEQYGRELADAVNRVLAASPTPIHGHLLTSYQEIELPFAEVPSREQLQSSAQAKDRYEQARARLLLESLQSRETLPATYPYPIEIWKLGTGPDFIMLGGEVVVDYSLRIKQQLGGGSVWVAAYANDVMAYIPSRRVWSEGGYEGGGAMVYYGQPSRWSDTVEELIVGQVEKQARQLASELPLGISR